MSTTQAAEVIAGSTTSGDDAARFVAGDTIACSADAPLRLDDACVWDIVSGQVDLFTVRLRDDEPVGPRTHLLRACEGDALFGVGGHTEPQRYGLIAVGFPSTRLRRRSRSIVFLEDRLRDLALLERWIHLIYDGLTRDGPRPPVSIDLKSNQETEVAQGASSRPGSELSWVRHLEGYSRLLGREGLDVGVDGIVPIARPGWLVAGAASRLVSLDTSLVSTVEELWDGLMRLRALVLRHAELAATASERGFLDRMRQRSQSQRAMLVDACERLIAGAGHTTTTTRPAVRTEAGVSVSAATAADPLLAACALVGGALDIAIAPAPRAPNAPPPRDPLAAILRASRVRSRRVALRGQWWREDNGPLIAQVTEGKRPVALLRHTASGPYVLHDPADHSQRPVTAAVAETLEPFADSLYRPFPERRLRARDIVSFGLHGGRRDLLVLVLVAICGSVLGMIPALATGMLFNSVIPGAQRSQLLQMTFVLFGCACATALFNLAQGVALLRIEGRASAALQSAVWDRLLTLPLAFFRPYTAGDLAVRAMAIDSMRQVISGATASALMGVILALGNFALMYYYSWKMALSATAIIGLLIIVTLAGSYLQLRPQRESTKLQSKVSGLVLQLLSGVAKLRVAAAEVPAFALWARRFGEQRRLQSQSRMAGNWVTAFNAAVPVASYLIVFSIARPLIASHAVATGEFLGFLTAFSAATGSMLGASVALLATLNTIPMYEEAKPILDTLPEVDLAKSDPGIITGDIEIQHAMFRYQADGPLVLRDVSFRIKPGEFVAFVGPSGSGKSTLLRLLLGFETLEAGTIYYDGQEIGGLDIQAVRRQMGVVLQSGRLMSGDIFTNIVGSTGTSLREAWNAARMAGLAEDIEAMPMGMHTVVSEGGGTLSGGQRQRLLIARAIVSRPRVLLFDEATSALDNRTQAIVSKSLESLQATRIVVAHRLSTIVNADRIIVFERGRLVQSGSYADLVREPGPFKELAERQIA
jgi:NHLM bacteriocin system ABC transporter ATP-binding protein